MLLRSLPSLLRAAATSPAAPARLCGLPYTAKFAVTSSAATAPSCWWRVMASAAPTSGAAGTTAAKSTAAAGDGAADDASTSFKFGMCQFVVGDVKASNLKTAADAVAQAVGKGAQLVSLPECFNSPYATAEFPKHAEEVPASADDIDEAKHPSTHMLVTTAKAHGIYLIGGSIPERDAATGNVYNTSLVVGPDGSLLARHRKMHLFDIDVPGKITFKESDTLSAGNQYTMFETPWGRVGVAICYDMRFPLLAGVMRAAGASMIVYPGAFNTTTGPAHWELLLRARAVDNQVYVAGVSPARSPEEGGYPAWGHSTLVNPWGEVLATTGHEAAVLVHDVDMARVGAVRDQVPVSKQVRTDLYNLNWVADKS